MRCWVISMPTDYNHNKTNHKWGVKIAFLHKSGGFLGHNFSFQLGVFRPLGFFLWSLGTQSLWSTPRWLQGFWQEEQVRRRWYCCLPFHELFLFMRRHCYLVRSWEVHISKIQCFGDKGGRGFCYFGSRILKCTFHLFIWIEPLISQGQPATS